MRPHGPGWSGFWLVDSGFLYTLPLRPQLLPHQIEYYPCVEQVKLKSVPQKQGQVNTNITAGVELHDSTYSDV